MEIQRRKRNFYPDEKGGYLIKNETYSVSFAGVSQYPPLVVEIMPTLSCNLRCRDCDRGIEDSELEDFNNIKILLENLSKDPAFVLRGFRLSGGEPTIYPRINDLIQYLHDLDPFPRIELITNGITVTSLDKKSLADVELFISVYSNTEKAIQRNKTIETLMAQGVPVNKLTCWEHENISNHGMIPKEFDPTRFCLIPTLIGGMERVYPCCRAHILEQGYNDCFHVDLHSDDLFGKLRRIITGTDMCSHCPRMYKDPELRPVEQLNKEASGWRTITRPPVSGCECPEMGSEVFPAGAIYPDSAEDCKIQGDEMLALARLDEAEAAYRRAVQLDLNYAEGYNSLGNVLRLTGRYEESESVLTEALRLKPDSAEIYNNYGTLLVDSGQLDAAEKVFREIIVACPDFGLAYLNRGNVLRLTGRLSPAVKCYRQAIALLPGNPDPHIGLGQSLLYLDEVDEAEQIFTRLLEILPECPEAYNGLANAWIKQGRVKAAEEAYEKAIALKPGFLKTQFNLSMAKLLTGDQEEGFKLHELRFEVGSPLSFGPTRNHFKQLESIPRWAGENGKYDSLLLLTEQGFGDSIMMMRYLPLLKRRGFRKINVCCEQALVRLFDSFPEVDVVYRKEEVLPPMKISCFCPMMSLPYLFGTTLNTIPAAVPYLSVAESAREKWRERLKTVTGLKVGLAWASSGNLLIRNRSIPLSSLTSLAGINGVQLVSLQKGEHTAQLRELQLPVLDFMGDCHDFYDTAALMAELDLVISVCTSTVHLAGALGRPVWLLNRFESEWRWMLDREDSPWYPTMKIFRQQKRGEWGPVIDRVTCELTQMASLS